MMCVIDNTISFAKNVLPGQFVLRKCLTRPLTIIAIKYPADPSRNYLDFLLINSTTSSATEIQRLSAKYDDISLDIINFLKSQGLENFIYYSPNGSRIEPYNVLDMSRYCFSVMDCNYFILLYLETRLMNPSLTISEINDLIPNVVTGDYFVVDSVISEIVNRPCIDAYVPAKHDIFNYPPPLRSSLRAINILGPKRGLVLCKGHKYIPLSRTLPRWVPQDIQWVYMDNSPATEHDIIGDVTSYESYERAGFSNYDYVFVENCLIDFITEILRGSRMVLKPGGKLVYPNFISIMKRRIAENPENERLFRENQQYVDEYVRKIIDDLLKSEQYSSLIMIDNTEVLTVKGTGE